MKAKIQFIPWRDQGNQRFISQREAIDIIGAERFQEMLEDAKATFADDPETAIETWLQVGASKSISSLDTPRDGPARGYSCRVPD